MLPTLGSRAARSAGLRIAAVAPAAHVSCAASSTAAAEHMADAAETEHYAAAATSYHKAFFYTGDYEAWQRKCAPAHARAKRREPRPPAICRKLCRPRADSSWRRSTPALAIASSTWEAERGALPRSFTRTAGSSRRALAQPARTPRPARVGEAA